MAGSEDTDIQWLERDSREWVLFAHQPDQLTARMTCTYLETGGVEARVGSQGGRYCVEVPVLQLEKAYSVYTPHDSAIAPPMQEDSRSTGIHTGRRLREQLRPQTETARPRRLLKWLVRLAVIGALAAVILLAIEL
ncbi:MAG: hypothetical protein ICCCNLDF_01635 [Planctomycetes bacterium]|nr:hypothetical protein [Planctomycetota bacterium]